MADEKISALPNAAALAGANIFPVLQGGANVKATLTQLLTLVAAISSLTGDVTATGPGAAAATIGAKKVTTAKIDDAAVTATQLATDAVTTAKILNANVTLAKLANAAANKKLLGSGASGSGAAYAELGIGSTLRIAGTTLDANTEMFGYLANNFYWTWNPNFTIMANSTVALSLNTIHWCPIWIDQPITISALGFKLGIASAANNAQVALYANDPTTMRPIGNAVCSTGNLSTTTIGFVSGAVSVALSRGIYWAAINMDNNVAQYGALGQNGIHSSTFVGASAEADLGAAAAPQFGTVWSTASTFNTWPNNPALTEAAQTNVNITSPILYFKVASVP
jgi:hypothetical protein